MTKRVNIKFDVDTELQFTVYVTKSKQFILKTPDGAATVEKYCDELSASVTKYIEDIIYPDDEDDQILSNLKDEDEDIFESDLENSLEEEEVDEEIPF